MVATMCRWPGADSQAMAAITLNQPSGSWPRRMRWPSSPRTPAAGYAIPAVVQSAALTNVLGAAPAVIGGAALVQGGFRGTDALLGIRCPLDQFAHHCAGFEPGAAPQAPQGLPAFAPRLEENPARVNPARVDARPTVRGPSTGPCRRRKRPHAPVRLLRKTVHGHALQARAAQEEAMWRDRSEAEVRSNAEDVLAQDEIAEGYRLLARAEAAKQTRVQQEAQARVEADRQNSEAERVSVTRAREFERARGQVPTDSDRAKSAQTEAAYKAQAAQEAAFAGPRGWSARP